MAKRSEDGIEYFPMNTDIIQNPKIKLVVAEFGPKAWAVLLPLYCKIYREKGYWIDWLDEDSKLLFAQDECKTELSVVNEFVSGCLRRSLFDKGVFEMFGILTSDRIQENYLIAKKRNKSVNFIDQFSLISKDVYNSFHNVNIIGLNVNIITKKGIILKQKKKEIIEEEGEGDKPEMQTQEQINLFNDFQKWLNKTAPRVNKLKEPLTIEEYFKLRQKVSKEVLTKVLIAMQNRNDLLKRYVSAYLTILNWSKREDDPVPKIESGVISINEKLKKGNGSH